MQQSLKILTDVPDYTDRVARLETLKNRLEALMSPTIIAAFNAHDVGERTCLRAAGASSTYGFTSLDMSRSFAQVFQSMDRAEQLEDLYVTSVKVMSDSSHARQGTAELHRAEQTEHTEDFIHDLDSSRRSHCRNHRQYKWRT